MRKLIKIILIGLLFSSCLHETDKIEFKEVRNVYNSVSPFISSINGLDSLDKVHAVNNLIKQGINKGFPLIEIDSLYPDYVFATFIYFDSTQNNQVEFEVFGIYDEPRFGDKRLYQLDSTDLYYRTYMIPNDLCLSYRFVLTDKISGKKQRITDPLNNDLIPKGERKWFSWSVLDLRTDEKDWNTKRYDNIGSRLDTFKITSKLLDNSRNIYVYLPNDYEKTAKKYPVIYLFDSFIYLNRVEVPNVLDNLIYENKIEPMVAVFIDNPTRTSRGYELPMNSIFKDFVVKELIPQIHERYRITDIPDKTIIGGMSYGGLAATYIALDCDSIFGRILSQSGSYWRDTVLTDVGGEWIRTDYLIKRFLAEDKNSLGLYLDWGLQEDWCKVSGRRFVKVLKAKGYDFSFDEFNGWHDWSNSRKTFSNGLLYLTDNE